MITMLEATHGRPCFQGVENQSVFDTTKLSQILSLQLSSYIGKPVDSLLQALPSGYSARSFMPVGIGYAIGVDQSYFTGEFNNCAIQIYVNSWQYMAFPNRTPTSTWNWNLAKQETISFIKVIKNNNVCVYGCNNPDYNY